MRPQLALFTLGTKQLITIIRPSSLLQVAIQVFCVLFSKRKWFSRLLAMEIWTHQNRSNPVAVCEQIVTSWMETWWSVSSCPSVRVSRDVGWLVDDNENGQTVTQFIDPAQAHTVVQSIWARTVMWLELFIWPWHVHGASQSVWPALDTLNHYCALQFCKGNWIYELLLLVVAMGTRYILCALTLNLCSLLLDGYCVGHMRTSLYLLLALPDAPESKHEEMATLAAFSTTIY